MTARLCGCSCFSPLCARYFRDAHVLFLGVGRSFCGLLSETLPRERFERGFLPSVRSVPFISFNSPTPKRRAGRGSVAVCGRIPDPPFPENSSDTIVPSERDKERGARRHGELEKESEKKATCRATGQHERGLR